MTDIDAIKKRGLEGNMSHWQDVATLVERIQELEALLREAPILYEWPEEEMEDEEGEEYNVYLVHGDWWSQLTVWCAKKDKLLEGKEKQ